MTTRTTDMAFTWRPALRAARRAVTALTWREARVAALLGASLGVVSGIASAVWSMGHVVENFAYGVLIYFVLALLLLPCVTALAHIPTGRLPGWAAIAAAGAGCSLLSFAIVGHLVMPSLFDVPGVTPNMAAQTLPPFMMTGLFAALGYWHWRDATRRAAMLRHLQLEHLRFSRATYEARLVALQARVEPRFLFETLSDAERLYDLDAALGARVIDDLIVHLRAALPAIEATSSTLAAEMDLVRTWLDIMRVRSGDTMLLAMPEVDAPGDTRMPPMVLLPLVQHAVCSGSDGVRAVLVSAALDGDRLRVTVVGPAAAFASVGADGVGDIGERVAAVFGDRATLTLQSALSERSQAILEVPYERTHRGPR